MGAECVRGGQLCPLLFHPKAGSGVCITCPADDRTKGWLLELGHDMASKEPRHILPAEQG